MEGQMIEWAPFQVREGVTEEELLAASHELQSGFLERQAGFVRRELLRGPDGSWCDLVYWKDATAAKSAIAHAMESPACARYFGLMRGVEQEDPGAGLLHFEVRRTYSLEAAVAR